MASCRDGPYTFENAERKETVISRFPTFDVTGYCAKRGRRTKKKQIATMSNAFKLRDVSRSAKVEKVWEEKCHV